VQGNLLRNLDALPVTGIVTVRVVLGTSGVVHDVNLRNEHGERRFGEICFTASPFNDTGSIFAWVTTGPDSHTHSTWSLRVVFAVECERVVVKQSTHKITVNPPLELLSCPDGSIVVVTRLRRSAIAIIRSVVSLKGMSVKVLQLLLNQRYTYQWIPDCSVIECSIALAEEVCLDVSRISTQEFPVYFVQIIRLKDDGGNNASAVGSLHDDRNLAKEDVKGRLNSWRVAGLVNSELGALAAICHRTGGCIPDHRVGRLCGKVESCIGSESRIIGTVGGVEWVT